MCYMPTKSTAQAVAPRHARVGVRELRQNLSVYLERVVAGEVLQVTDRGRPVAMLVPLSQATTTVERLVASGRAIPAKHDLLALGLPPGRPSKRLSRRIREALEYVRQDIV